MFNNLEFIIIDDALVDSLVIIMYLYKDSRVNFLQNVKYISNQKKI